MTKHDVALLLVDLLYEQPELFSSPQGKGNFTFYLGQKFNKWPTRKTIKRALKLMVKLNILVKIENDKLLNYENPCSRYRKPTSEELFEETCND